MALPESLGSLADLQILDLGHNALTEIPAALAKLTRLRFLYLSDNRLRALPESLLADLHDLRYLGVTDNQLAALPESHGRTVAVAGTAALQQLADGAARLARPPG